MSKRNASVKTVNIGGNFAVEVARLTKKDRAKLTLVGLDCNCRYGEAKIHICEDCVQSVLNHFVSFLYHEGFEVINDRDECVFRDANEVISEVMAYCRN